MEMDREIEKYWDMFAYDTGETTDEYAPDTIGGINGFNNKQARLPQKIEDIAALFHGKAVH